MTLRPLPIAGLLAVVVLVAGAVFVPQPRERLAMLVRDGEQDVAVAEAARLVAAGDRDPATLLDVFDLADRFGDHRLAGKALDLYLRERPADLGAWKRAAAFHETTGDIDAQVRALVEVAIIGRDALAAERAGRVLRLHGRIAEERSTLVRLAAGPMTVASLDRLADLLVVDGRQDEAIEVLRRLDAMAPPGLQAPRVMLLQMLAQGGRFAEARDRAMRWFGTWQAPALRVALSMVLVRAGAGGEALDLVGSAADDPQAVVGLFHALAAEGRFDLARDLHERRSRAPAPPQPVEVQAYVDAAIASGAIDMVVQDVARLGSTRPDRAVMLVEALARRSSLAAVADVARMLPPEALAGRPIFAAEATALARSPEWRRRIVAQADLVAMAERERMEWLAIARSAFAPSELHAHLIGLAAEDRLPADLVPALVDLARGLGRIGEAQAIASSVRRAFQEAARF